MSYEDNIQKIEDEIQRLNVQISMLAIQNKDIMKDPKKVAEKYLPLRKEAAVNIYSILLTAFEFTEKRAEEAEQEVDRLKTEIDSMTAVIANLNGQVEHWKEKYENKIYAND